MTRRCFPCCSSALALASSEAAAELAVAELDSAGREPASSFESAASDVMVNDTAAECRSTKLAPLFVANNTTVSGSVKASNILPRRYSAADSAAASSDLKLLRFNTLYFLFRHFDMIVIVD